MTDHRRLNRDEACASQDQRGPERRNHVRHEYADLIAMIIRGDGNIWSAPILMLAVNISEGGLCALGREAVPPQTMGLVQMVKRSGEMAVVGVEVLHCHYEGDLRHRISMRFSEPPNDIHRIEALHDGQHMRLLHPLLRANYRPQPVG